MFLTARAPLGRALTFQPRCTIAIPHLYLALWMNCQISQRLKHATRRPTRMQPRALHAGVRFGPARPARGVSVNRTAEHF